MWFCLESANFVNVRFDMFLMLREKKRGGKSMYPIQEFQLWLSAFVLKRRNFETLLVIVSLDGILEFEMSKELTPRLVDEISNLFIHCCVDD